MEVKWICGPTKLHAIDPRSRFGYGLCHRTSLRSGDLDVEVLERLEGVDEEDFCKWCLTEWMRIKGIEYEKVYQLPNGTWTHRRARLRIFSADWKNRGWATKEAAEIDYRITCKRDREAAPRFSTMMEARRREPKEGVEE